jgi:hypothetical protein
MKAIFPLFFFLPLVLQAQVYRCDGPDGAIYSQIPCEENAEEVTIEDTRMLTEGGDSSDTLPEAGRDAAAEDLDSAPVNLMDSFVTTLVSQRESQIGEIDRKIAEERVFISSDEFNEADEETRSNAIGRLAKMQSERQSILEQYESLIQEAERRAAEG